MTTMVFDWVASVFSLPVRLVFAMEALAPPYIYIFTYDARNKMLHMDRVRTPWSKTIYIESSQVIL